MTKNITTQSYDRSELNRLINGGESVYRVRAGVRHIGYYIDAEFAEQMAEFYDAEVFDWETGDRV